MTSHCLSWHWAWQCWVCNIQRPKFSGFALTSAFRGVFRGGRTAENAGPTPNANCITENKYSSFHTEKLQFLGDFAPQISYRAFASGPTGECPQIPILCSRAFVTYSNKHCYCYCYFTPPNLKSWTRPWTILGTATSVTLCVMVTSALRQHHLEVGISSAYLEDTWHSLPLLHREHVVAFLGELLILTQWYPDFNFAITSVNVHRSKRF